MFDVSWSDPERETVKQRKERKEKEATGGVHSSGSSTRSTKSNDSARPATRVSLLTFLNGSRKEGDKKDATARSLPPSKLASSSPPWHDTNHSRRRFSSGTEKTDTSLQEELSSPTTPTPGDDGYYLTSPDIHHSMNSASTTGSIFSGRTGHSEATNTSWGSIIESSRKPSLVQPLSPKSFVTQTTEITVSSNESMHDIERLATLVHISSNGNDPTEVNRSSLRLSTSPVPFDGGMPHGSSETLSIAEEAALLEPSNWPNWKPLDSWDTEDDEQTLPALPRSPIPPFSPPPPQSPLPSLPRHCLSTSTDRSRRKAKPKNIRTSTEISYLQKSIRLKEAATAKIMLERLKEEWMVTADASMFRELELEKQLWMLTALRAEHKHHQIKELKEERVVENHLKIFISPQEKILSLYENYACVSFLSALSPDAEFHHLSTQPLTSKPSHKIQSLTTPNLTPTLPYESSNFSSIHAFPLASGLFPSTSIPSILYEIRRCLRAESGRLHLTIIDPSPTPATTGPRLRTWLENHLITNLERQFRCLNPSRLFPIWLADAGLRGPGSNIRDIRFRAVVSAPAGGGNGDKGGADEARGVREELRSVVGRMLWREMWGGWVEGRDWWWDRPDIVEECERMGTVWQYYVIEANNHITTALPLFPR